MKIIPENQPIKPASTESVQKKQKTGKDSFGRMLDSMIDKTSKKETVVTPTKTFNTGPVLQATSDMLTHEMKQPVIKNTENLLTLLDEYRQKLADPRFSLKDINPLVDRLSSENKNLAEIMGSLPEGDGLKDIARKTLITSSLEVIRFNKGDYIDS